MKVTVLAVLLAACLLPAVGRAEGVDEVGQGAVAAALDAAGGNRAEIEGLLQHYARSGDGQKLAAARFLVANMVDKGYVVTVLRDAEGAVVPYDPLDYADFKEAQAALDALEREHGTLEFDRDHLVKDIETATRDFLVRHVDQAFEAWRGTPEALRVDFDAFCEHVLPYRGSQEPLDDWIGPLRRRYAGRARDLGSKIDMKELYQWLSKDVHRRVRFDERFYLHPTDQSFTEMGRSGQGRCEDITNMMTFVARSMAIPTAADYTPYWAHRDNNHAWNVLLDKQGRGSAPSNAHAAKVYRKTFSIQRGALAFQLPEGRKAPNRFLQSTSYVDVTAQYAPTTDVAVQIEPPESDFETDFAYLCVFNGGAWKAIQWSRWPRNRASFAAMGRGILYLPAIFDQQALVPASPPLVVNEDGTVRLLDHHGAKVDLLAVSVAPRKVSPDTNEVTPVSHLEAGTTYVLHRWADGWVAVTEATAGEEPLRFEGLDADALYWLVAKDSRRLERPFTIEDGRQRFW